MTEGTLPEPPLPAPLPERPLPEPWLRGMIVLPVLFAMSVMMIQRFQHQTTT